MFPFILHERTIPESISSLFWCQSQILTVAIMNICYRVLAEKLHRNTNTKPSQSFSSYYYFQLPVTYIVPGVTGWIQHWNQNQPLRKMKKNASLSSSFSRFWETGKVQWRKLCLIFTILHKRFLKNCEFSLFL